MFLLKPVRIWPCTEIGLAFSIPSGDWCAADENLCWGGWGATEWENFLLSHWVSNAWFTYLLLGQRWPRRQQWHGTSRCRVILCFGIWKRKSHNVMKGTNNVSLSYLLGGLCSVQDGRLGTRQPTKEGQCTVLHAGNRRQVSWCTVLMFWHSLAYFKALYKR